ncbi:hypothetical protein KIPB_000861 [Kipferlia bialata]|uniref:AAA+ ATPase domain-containing protein n=1 Tax=Kipferlia bialata TaxID=797122 RepID=A0A9K3GF14_9EUKA|nr:hypothetical protein KIPB_000861 [Kipferlia bialata]|eukprot:g861.t1
MGKGDGGIPRKEGTAAPQAVAPQRHQPKPVDLLFAVDSSSHDHVTIVHTQITPTISSAAETQYFKCSFGGGLFSHREWETDQPYPVMSVARGERDRNRSLLGGTGIYLGVVLTKSGRLRPGSDLTTATSLLVSTAMRWCSDRVGLRMAIVSVCSRARGFTCPRGKPVFPGLDPRPHKLRVHRSLSDAVTVVSPLSGVAGLVAKGPGIFHGFDPSELFAADSLPRCGRDVARSLAEADVVRTLHTGDSLTQRLSPAGAALCFAVSQERHGPHKPSVVTHEILKLAALAGFREALESVAPLYGRYVAGSGLLSSSRSKDLLLMVNTFPYSGFWDMVFERWSLSIGGSQSSLAFLGSLPFNEYPAQTSVVLLAATHAGLFSVEWTVAEVLARPMLLQYPRLLQHVVSIAELQTKQTATPLSVILGPVCGQTQRVPTATVVALCTALGLGECSGVVPAALDTFEQASGILSRLHHLLTFPPVSAGQFGAALTTACSTIESLLQSAQASPISDVSGILTASSFPASAREVGDYSTTELYKYFLAHPGAILETTNDSAEGSWEDLISLTSRMEDLLCRLRDRTVGMELASVLSSVPFRVLAQLPDSSPVHIPAGRGWEAYIQSLCAINDVLAVQPHLILTLSALGAVDTDSLSRLNALGERMSAIAHGACYLQDSDCTPLLSFLVGLSQVPGALEFYQAGAGECQDTLSFVTGQTISTANLLGQIRHRGTTASLSVVREFTAFIVDAKSPIHYLKARLPLEVLLSRLASVDYQKYLRVLLFVQSEISGLRQLIEDSEGSSTSRLTNDSSFILSRGFELHLSSRGPRLVVKASLVSLGSESEESTDTEDIEEQSWDTQDLEYLKNQIVFSGEDSDAPLLLVTIIDRAQWLCETDMSTLVGLRGYDKVVTATFRPSQETSDSVRTAMLQQLEAVRKSIAREVTKCLEHATAVRRNPCFAFMTAHDCQANNPYAQYHRHFADMAPFVTQALSSPVSLSPSTVMAVAVEATGPHVLDIVQILCRSASLPLLSVRNVHLGSGESTIEDIRAIVAHATLFPEACHVVALPSQMATDTQDQMRTLLSGQDPQCPLPRHHGPIVLLDIPDSVALSFPVLSIDQLAVQSLALLKHDMRRHCHARVFTSDTPGQGKTIAARQFLQHPHIVLHLSGPATLSRACASIAAQLSSPDSPYYAHVEIGSPLGDGGYTPGQWIAEAAVFSLQYLGGLRSPGAIVPAPVSIAIEIASDVSEFGARYSAVLAAPVTQCSFPPVQQGYVTMYNHAVAPVAFTAAQALYVLENNGASSGLVELLCVTDKDLVLAHAYNVICDKAQCPALFWSMVEAVLLSIGEGLQRVCRCPFFWCQDCQDGLAARREVVSFMLSYAVRYNIDAVVQAVSNQSRVLASGRGQGTDRGNDVVQFPVGYSNLTCTYFTLDASFTPFAFSSTHFEWPPGYRNMLESQGSVPPTDTLSADELKHKIIEFCLGPRASQGASSFTSSIRTFEFTPDVVLKLSMIHSRSVLRRPVILIGDGGTGKTAVLTVYLEMMQHFSQPGYFGYSNATVNASTAESAIVALFDTACRKSVHVARYIMFLDEINASPFSTEILAAVQARRFRGVTFPDSLSIVTAVNPLRSTKRENRILRSMHHTVPYVFRVNPIPQSMLGHMLDFGSLNQQDEEKYVTAILERADLSDRAKQRVISTHQAAKGASTGFSFAVSLRDVVRFLALYDVATVAFSEQLEDETLSRKDVVSFILHITYVLRIPDAKRRKRVTSAIGHSTAARVGDCTDVCLSWLHDDSADHGGPVIAKNQSFCENACAILMCVWAKVPLIIVGEPGTSKSLALRVCYDFLSSPRAFDIYPTRVQQCVYQGTIHSTTEGIERVQSNVLDMVPEDESDSVTPLFVFDELGRAAQAQGNPLKALHSILEPPGGQENLQFAFIGLSNNSIDSAPTSRALVVYRLAANVDLSLTVGAILGPAVPSDVVKRFTDSHIALVDSMNGRVGRRLFGLRDMFFLAHRMVAVAGAVDTSTESVVRHLVDRCYSIAYTGNNAARSTRMERSTAAVLNCLRHAIGVPLSRHSQPRTHMGRMEHCSAYSALADAVNDVHECCRFLLVQTESPEIVVDAITTTLHPSRAANLDILRGSYFPADLDASAALTALSRIIEGARRGGTVVLVSQQQVLDSLYDMLNKNYMRFSTPNGVNMRCRVALGNVEDTFVPVHPDFKLVICMSKREVDREADALLHRLEKIRLDVGDVMLDMSEETQGDRDTLYSRGNTAALVSAVRGIPMLGSVDNVRQSLLWRQVTNISGGSTSRDGVLVQVAHLIPPRHVYQYQLSKVYRHHPERNPLLNGDYYAGCLDVLDAVLEEQAHVARHGQRNGVPVVIYTECRDGFGGSADELVSKAAGAGLSLATVSVAQHSRERDFAAAVSAIPEDTVCVCFVGRYHQFISQCQWILQRRKGVNLIAVVNACCSVTLGVATDVWVVDCLVTPSFLPVRFEPQPKLDIPRTITVEHPDTKWTQLVRLVLQRACHVALRDIGSSHTLHHTETMTDFLRSHSSLLSHLMVRETMERCRRLEVQEPLSAGLSPAGFNSLAQATSSVLQSLVTRAIAPLLLRLAGCGLLCGVLDEADSAQREAYTTAVNTELGAVPTGRIHTTSSVASMLNRDLRAISTLTLYTALRTVVLNADLPMTDPRYSEVVAERLPHSLCVFAAECGTLSTTDIMTLTHVLLTRWAEQAASVTYSALEIAIQTAVGIGPPMQAQGVSVMDQFSAMLVRGVISLCSEYSRFSTDTIGGRLALSRTAQELRGHVLGLPTIKSATTCALLPTDQSHGSLLRATPPTKNRQCQVFATRLVRSYSLSVLLQDTRPVSAPLSVYVSNAVLHAMQSGELEGGTIDLLPTVGTVLSGNTLTVAWAVAAGAYRYIAGVANDTGGAGSSPELAALVRSSTLAQMAFVWHCRHGHEGDMAGVIERVAAVLGQAEATDIFAGSYAERYPLTGVVDWALHSMPAFGGEAEGETNETVAQIRRGLVMATTDVSTRPSHAPDAMVSLFRDVGLDGIALVGEVVPLIYHATDGSLLRRLLSDLLPYLPFEWLKAVYAGNSASTDGARTSYTRRHTCGEIIFTVGCIQNGDTGAVGELGHTKCVRCPQMLTAANTAPITMSRTPAAQRVLNDVFYTDVEQGFVDGAVPPYTGQASMYPFTSHMQTSQDTVILVRGVIAAARLALSLMEASATLSPALRTCLVKRVRCCTQRLQDRALPLVRTHANLFQSLTASGSVFDRYQQELQLIRSIDLSRQVVSVRPSRSACSRTVFPLDPSEAEEQGHPRAFVSLLRPSVPADLGTAGSAALIGGAIMPDVARAAAWCTTLSVLHALLSIPLTVLKPLRFALVLGDSAVMSLPLETVVVQEGGDLFQARRSVEAWNSVVEAFPFQFHFHETCDDHDISLLPISLSGTLADFVSVYSDSHMEDVLADMVWTLNTVTRCVASGIGIPDDTLETVSPTGWALRETPLDLTVSRVTPLPSFSVKASRTLSMCNILSGFNSLVLLSEEDSPFQLPHRHPQGCLQWVKEYEGAGDPPNPVPTLSDSVTQALGAVPLADIGRAAGECCIIENAVTTTASMDDAHMPLLSFLERQGVLTHIPYLTSRHLVSVEVCQVLRLVTSLHARLPAPTVAQETGATKLTRDHIRRVGALCQQDRGTLIALVPVIARRMGSDELSMGHTGSSDIYCTQYEIMEAGSAVCEVLDETPLMPLLRHLSTTSRDTSA